MSSRLRLVGTVAVCLAVVATAPVTDAQVMSATPGQSPALSVSGGLLGPYTPPTCVPGVPFSDITCTTGFDPWIEQFGLDGITAGCGGGKYCPSTPVTRDQMAVFIEKSMRGTANWPPHTQIVWAVKNSDGSPNPTASGTALLNAVAAIPTSGNDAPTGANPWLVTVGPGVFQLGSSQLVIPAWVNVAGSGIDGTYVKGAITGPGGSSSAVVYCSGGNELRHISIYNAGGAGLNSTAVWLAGDVRLTAVFADAGGGSNINTAIAVVSGSPTLTDVEGVGVGGTFARGLEGDGGSVEIRGGAYDGFSGSSESSGIAAFTGATIQALHTRLGGSTPAKNWGGATISVAGSQLSGGSVYGTVACAGVYDGSFGFHASTCP